MPPITMLDEVSTSSYSVTDDAKAELISSCRKVERRHSVDFKGSNEIHEFDKCHDDERDDYWYSKEEYDIIKARNSLIVKMMKTGSFQESNDHSFRGLEHKLKVGFKQRRTNKFNALNAVLEEQDRQHAKSQQEPHKIAELYGDVSMNAKHTAFAIALKDAEAVGMGFWDGNSSESDNVSLLSKASCDLDDLSVISESSEQKKTRIKRLFGTLSERKQSRMNRRGSL